jgi:hypothetical protein
MAFLFHAERSKKIIPSIRMQHKYYLAIGSNSVGKYNQTAVVMAGILYRKVSVFWGMLVC